MRDGIYEALFTTNQGTLGVAAVLIKQNSFAGADGLQFYRGKIDPQGNDVSVIMEVTRHNFAVPSVFGNEGVFTLQWFGRWISNTQFKVECRPPGSDLSIFVTGKLIGELPTS